jgi:hypothetical protein
MKKAFFQQSNRDSPIQLKNSFAVAQKRNREAHLNSLCMAFSRPPLES